MKSDDRKAAVAAYKERKAVAGIYAVRCMATGACWVGRTLDLAQIENRVRFTLRHGGTAPLSLQAARHQHDPDSFTVETIERLEEEELVYARDRLLKDRLAHWRDVLGAEAI